MHVFNLQTEAEQIKLAWPCCKKNKMEKWWNNNCWVLNQLNHYKHVNLKKCKVANIIMIYWALVTSGHYVPVNLHFSVCFFRSDSTERPSWGMFPRSEWRPSTGPSIKHRPHQDGDTTMPPEKLHQVGGLSVFAMYLLNTAAPCRTVSAEQNEC